jgi:hypothetical protein
MNSYFHFRFHNLIRQQLYLPFAWQVNQYYQGEVNSQH